MITELIWQYLDTPGWEHVRINRGHPGWTVFDSIFVREHEGEVLRGGYTLVVDKQWRTLELRLMVESAPGEMLGVHLLSEGDGRWTDIEGNSMSQLDGCLDVDITWSPLTKTLATNRLQLPLGVRADILTAQVAMPSLEIAPIEVVLEQVEGSTVLVTPGEVLSIDSEGFLQNPASIFHRMWP